MTSSTIRASIRRVAAAAITLASFGAVAGTAAADSPDHRDRAHQMINVDDGTVVVYEDGRVYRRVDTDGWYTPTGLAAASGVRMAPPPPPGALEWATLSDAAIDDLVAQIVDLGLLDDLEFGEPMITDSPTSQLTLSIDGDETTHSVYAPGYEHGLTPEEKANRAACDELRALLFDLESAFGDELTPFSAYVPDRWVIMVDGYWYGPVDRPWPLDDEPVDGTCVELSTADDTDTATGGYLVGDDVVVADAALPNDPRCEKS